MQYCASQTVTSDGDDKLLTRHRSVLMTENRLQLALRSGLVVTDWTFDTWSEADLICIHSLEPAKVMKLLRVHGVPWSTQLCHGAAFYSKLVLLQWSHTHSCPWNELEVLHAASAGGSIATLEWLVTVTLP
jgi:hypothetical protein